MDRNIRWEVDLPWCYTKKKEKQKEKEAKN